MYGPESGGRAFAWYDVDSGELTVTPGRYRLHFGTTLPAHLSARTWGKTANRRRVPQRSVALKPALPEAVQMALVKPANA
jgi:hypothetical protein